MQEGVVQGVRAPKNAPFAVSNIKKQDLETFSKTGQELPFLFALASSLKAAAKVAYSLQRAKYM